MAISDNLKDAIRNCGKSVSQIAVDTGVTQPAISRFLSDDPAQHRDIRLEATADKLASYFGLALAPVEKKVGKGSETEKSLRAPTKKPAAKRSK